ncbi:multiple epidermal growth factor-like domains protein 10 [Mercenaria mercenaria]|uniref:multiple epidermal growth factor-like domains protein 10 n=1 Tax=Mercenaria mercenaria TaxID=6596 RepID=UPI00234EC205|nr:multiple epidermal growth factor-like domains protein 10 [Mercenaria mercenaria]
MLPVSGECPRNCRNSTISGNSCCICEVFFGCGVTKCSKIAVQLWSVNSFVNCLGCDHHDHFPTFECMSCPVGCVGCFDHTLCLKCVNGMHGKICNKRCGKCRHDNQGVVKCDIGSGVCTNGCVDGYYSPRCDQVCEHCKPGNQSMVKCDYNSGICTNGCVDGYYSPRCNRVCRHCKPDNLDVVKCDFISGTCANGCVDGYYRRCCDRVCGHCKLDNQGVVKCDSISGICTNGCVDGFHSSRCDHICSGTCSKRACSQQSGYCDNGCVSGWYGDTCNDSCSDTCSLSSCYQTSGFCDNGCVSGWYGKSCGESCSNTCYDKSCDQFSGYCVNGCVSGWYGDTCNGTCSDTCSLSFCNQRSGFCEKGCVSGWHGGTCEESCSDTCSLSSCNQTSGFCEKGCVSGWHGYMCKLLCSSKCFNKSCDQYSGRCYNGCATAYYGNTCESNCLDTCKERVCDRETSRCLRGCVAGYQGAFCNMTMNIGPDFVLVGLASSLAGVIISLVFTLIIWCIRRRVLRGKQYDNFQVSTRDILAPTYDEVSDIGDAIEEHRISGSHLYMDIGTSQIYRSIHESGSNTHNSCDNEIAGNCATTLAVVETINNTPSVYANARNLSSLHSEVNNCNNGDSSEILTTSFISLDNVEVHRKGSNLSRNYYEISDKIPNHDHNIEIERNHANDGYEIPISGTCSAAQNAEASGACLSVHCNRMTDFATSPSRDSKRTQKKDVVSTRHKEINVDEINQTLQKPKEDKRNSSSSGFETDIPLETHQAQEKVTEGDSNSLNYIHPVN